MAILATPMGIEALFGALLRQAKIKNSFTECVWLDFIDIMSFGTPIGFNGNAGAQKLDQLWPKLATLNHLVVPRNWIWSKLPMDGYPGLDSQLSCPLTLYQAFHQQPRTQKGHTFAQKGPFWWSPFLCSLSSLFWYVQSLCCRGNCTLLQYLTC